MRVAGGLRLASALALGASGAAIAQQAMPDGDWRTINRDLASTRFSPLADINRGNVTQLRQAWAYPLKGSNTATPLVIDSTMYFPIGNRVVALDADSGAEKWVFTIPNGADGKARNASGRGLSYWEGDTSTPARVVLMVGTKMLAVDAATGRPSAGFGTDGMIDVGIGFGGTPTIAQGVAMIGAATQENHPGVAGNPRGFDVKTGRKLWEFQTVPQPGQPFNETWGNGWKGRSGTNQWGPSASVDTKTGTVIIPLGSPAPNYWGGDRPGSNLFGNSLLGLDIKTGQYRWHFQTVHHDLWDTDQPTAGPLIDVGTGRNRHPVIASVNKTSLFFVIDRTTGKPYLPVAERAVPVGDVPGEYYSPTQPFPVNTPPLSRVSMTYDDIVAPEDTNAAHAQACRDMWDKAGGYLNYGPFTPFMFHAKGTPPRSTIQFPGGTGGVNWGGPAADPNTGIVYVNAADTSLVGWTERKDTKESYSFDATDSDQPYDRASVDGKGPFFSFSAPLSGKYDVRGRGVGPSMNCYKGPWSELVAVDANTGAIKWSVPLGLNEDFPADKAVVQGNAGNAGPTVTAGGLVFVGATNDRRFRAFDSATGQQLWETRLSGNANANPMSYRARSGKQYVAINAGGTIMAYSLSR
ncbi:MAG: PQQ-binding-like beta-propeller repeat protein [Croceibacterium sp.]